jgi:hypothetical protein
MIGALTIDSAFDLEQSVGVPDRLEPRRDLFT